ncbi:putative Uncharacterized 16.3 kDa protein in TAR-I ttuC' 3'region [Paraburkholderia sabiae]|jgi:hypothetical protein|uniref:tripartite tricarboxylate transporter TctB family protein n=1 Tax=Paraburkholderia sabiae TaxID=273251 RepID=UPI001CAEECB7|nr:tripartite tricarboxylate transporter TctB family protein [Paraburkholderia sabiae]CAG9232640.1 putative Uncharacterized 16.3 kDa protein in TAR-I ttuC' 3'region [Paraburkholderia sabiae]
MTAVRNLNKDVVGGVLISGFGVAVAAHSLSAFAIGTLSQMGPGFFPLTLGVILMLSGVSVAIKGYLSAPRASKEAASRPPEWRAWFLICLGTASFVVVAKYAGMVPATFSIVFISALADRKNTWRNAAILGLAMALVGVVVFWWALQIQLPLFKWGSA